MNEKQAFIRILKEYNAIKDCLEKEKNLFFIRHLIGKLEGMEFCMSEIGYEFCFKENKWIISRKAD